MNRHDLEALEQAEREMREIRAQVSVWERMTLDSRAEIDVLSIRARCAQIEASIAETRIIGRAIDRLEQAASRAANR